MKRSFFRMVVMLLGVLLPTIARAGSFAVGSVKQAQVFTRVSLMSITVQTLASKSVYCFTPQG